MLIVGESDGCADTVKNAVRGGVNVVLLRWKSAASTRGFCSEMEEARREFRGQGLLVLHQAAADLRQQLQPDGIHYPEDVGFSDPAGPAGGSGLLIGRSVHSVKAAREAETDGADYVLTGTIFASASHPSLEPAGLEFLASVCRAVRIPVIAIGGITPENTPQCIASGAAGVAVLSGIMRSAKPGAAATRYRRALDLAEGLE